MTRYGVFGQCARALFTTSNKRILLSLIVVLDWKGGNPIIIPFDVDRY